MFFQLWQVTPIKILVKGCHICLLNTFYLHESFLWKLPNMFNLYFQVSMVLRYAQSQLLYQKTMVFMVTFLASAIYAWMEMKFSLQFHWTSWYVSDYCRLLSYKRISVSVLCCEISKIQVLLEWNLFQLINQEITVLFWL